MVKNYKISGGTLSFWRFWLENFLLFYLTSTLCLFSISTELHHSGSFIWFSHSILILFFMTSWELENLLPSIEIAALCEHKKERFQGYGFPCFMVAELLGIREMMVGGSIFAAGCQGITIAAAHCTPSVKFELKNHWWWSSIALELSS